MFKIAALEQQQRLLLITFDHEWDQDDIAQLSDIVLQQLNHEAAQDLHVIEHVKGADREYFRIRFQQDYLILQFESYSNSCWIEPEDQLEIQTLNVIHQRLI